MRGQVPAPSPVGAHIVRPRFLSKLRRRSGSPHPPAKKERMRDKIPKMSMDCTDIGRGLAPAAPFVGRGLPTRRPGLPRLRRRGGTLGRPPSNKRTPPKFPIYVSKRPTKGSIPPYLSSPKAFPPQGGRPTPPVRGNRPLDKGSRPPGRGKPSPNSNKEEFYLWRPIKRPIIN